MPVHPTILIGHGAFGRAVLRRLLASTAARGALSWQDPSLGGDPGALRLKGLSLLGVGKKGIVGGDAARGSAEELDHLGMFEDLYSQIEEVEAAPGEGMSGLARALAEAMEGAARRLLAAQERAADTSRLRLGLDLIVLARPSAPETLGELRNLLIPGMERLAGDASLSRVAEGHDRLNFMQILDFDHYWTPFPPGPGLRDHVHQYIQLWEQRLDQRRSGFGRTYLVDGYTRDGRRDEAYRLDEIALFLELLLFEGQRDGSLQKLYQRRSGHQPTVCTFGIRLVERSAGLLARLAAAGFGAGWLNHLAGARGIEGDGDLVDLRQQLSPYKAANLRQLLAADQLDAIIQAEVRRMEQELLDLSPDLPDWSERFRERAQLSLLQLKNRISLWAGERIQWLDKELLATFPRAVEEAVDGALHHPRCPAPLGRVMRELEDMIAEMQSLAPPPSEPGPAEDNPFSALEAAHVRYLEARAEQVDTGRLQRWWPLLAIAVAAAWSPLLLEAAAEVPAPVATSHHLLRLGHQVLLWFSAQPVVAGFLLLLGALALGRGHLQRVAVRLVRRALAFHTDPERGRLADRIRQALAPGGALRVQVDLFAQRVVRDLAARVRSDVQRETRRVLALLGERRREALWLRDQLIELLRVHSLDDQARGETFERTRRRPGWVRQSLESNEDLERTRQQNEPRPDRFRSIQSSERPFQSWSSRYCDAFLHPLSFLDGLSRLFPDPAERDMARPDSQQTDPLQRQLVESLRTVGSFAPSFLWPGPDEGATVEAHGLISTRWRDLPGVMQGLSNLAWSEQSLAPGSNPGRIYLLRVQIGTPTERLLGRSPVTVPPEAS